MRIYRGNLNRSTLWISSILILSFALIAPEQAASRTHTSEIALFISGLGLQVGSTILNTSAQERYEDYLTATIQEDIQNKKNAAAAHQNASVIMRRVGYGCIGLAVVISIFKQIDDIESNTVSSQIPTMSKKGLYLTDYNYKPTGLIMNGAPQFSLRPNYDFQKQRASLSLIRNF